MPIVAEHREPKKRHAPWWVLVLALAVLLPAGLIVWGYYLSLTIPLGDRELYLGVGIVNRGNARTEWYQFEDVSVVMVAISWDRSHYYMMMVQPLGTNPP